VNTSTDARLSLKVPLLWGVASGAFFGLYDAVALALKGMEAVETMGLRPWQHVAFQCALGGACGLLAGLLLPHLRTKPYGTLALGMIVGAVAIIGAAFPMVPLETWISDLPAYTVIGGLMGAYGGYRFRQELDNAAGSHQDEE